MLNVIVVEPSRTPYEKEIDGELKSLQEIVGGYIEVVNLGAGITLVCNEEGKINNFVANRVVGSDVICGTFFLSKSDNSTGEFVRLSEDEVDGLIKTFSDVYIA